MESENIQHASDSSFDQIVKGDTAVLVDFWAEWCMPCRRIAPTVEALAAEYGAKLVVAKMNVDDNPAVPMRLGIRSIPTHALQGWRDGGHGDRGGGQGHDQEDGRPSSRVGASWQNSVASSSSDRAPRG